MAVESRTLTALNITNTDLRDPFLRKFQSVFDQVAFDSEWPLLRAGVAFAYTKTEHIGNHVGNVLGKLRLAEVDPINNGDALRIEAFPDSLMYRTQLANTLRYDLAKRLGKVTTDSTSLVDVKDLVIDARAAVDRFDERIDHDKYIPAYLAQVRQIAIPALHFAGLIMANIYDTEPRVAHADRLMQHLRIRSVVKE